MQFLSKNSTVKDLVKTSFCFGRQYRHIWLWIAQLEQYIWEHHCQLSRRAMRAKYSQLRLEEDIEDLLYMLLRIQYVCTDYDPSDALIAPRAQLSMGEDYVNLRRIKQEIALIKAMIEVLTADYKRLWQIKLKMRKVLFEVRRRAISNNNQIFMAKVY